MISHYKLAKISTHLSEVVLSFGQTKTYPERASRPADSEGCRLIGSGGESSGEGDTPGKGADTREP